MSKKPFDYSKWDKIELSDDEDDVHPNIDKESWFRLKHRSRVEREENEEKDKANILAEMEKANKRIAILKHDLAKLEQEKKRLADSDDDDDDGDDLGESEGLTAELRELEQANAARRAKLLEYEKNKKWNVDNMFQVKEEKTIINPTAGTTSYTSTGFVKPQEELGQEQQQSKQSKQSQTQQKPAAAAAAATTTAKPADKAASDAEKKKPAAAAAAAATTTTSKAAPAAASKATPSPKPQQPRMEDAGAMETYHEFTEKYADVVEEFMKVPDLEGSKLFLLRNAPILLQENAMNYLLLASLEDEMNGLHEKMKRTARQSQIVSNIAELAKTLRTHPGNVIEPFFGRLQQREHLEEFLLGVKAFQDKIVKRAVVKRAEIDEQRRRQLEEEGGVTAATAEGGGATDLSEIPREERLGPGGLDPLEVIETLPPEMVRAFESRDVDQLKRVLMRMDPADAERHMKRCVDSGLWVANAES